MKHIQPNSEVYGLMEIKIFKELTNEISTMIETEDLIIDSKNSTNFGTTGSNVSINSTVTNSNSSNGNTNASNNNNSSTELKNIASRISTLVKFHWSVFGNYYIDYIKSQHDKSKLQESAIIPNMVGEENDESLTANNANNKTDSNKIINHHIEVMKTVQVLITIHLLR